MEIYEVEALTGAPFFWVRLSIQMACAEISSSRAPVPRRSPGTATAAQRSRLFCEYIITEALFALIPGIDPRTWKRAPGDIRVAGLEVVPHDFRQCLVVDDGDTIA